MSQEQYRGGWPQRVAGEGAVQGCQGKGVQVTPFLPILVVGGCGESTGSMESPAMLLAYFQLSFRPVQPPSAAAHWSAPLTVGVRASGRQPPTSIPEQVQSDPGLGGSMFRHLTCLRAVCWLARDSHMSTVPMGAYPHPRWMKGVKIMPTAVPKGGKQALQQR